MSNMRKALIIMAAVFSALRSAFAFSPNGRALCMQQHAGARRDAKRDVTARLLGGDDDDKPKLTRENEPDQYFESSFETLSTTDKFKDPLVIIGCA